MIRRPPRSTPLYSSAASDVYKRQAQHTSGPLGIMQPSTWRARTARTHVGLTRAARVDKFTRAHTGDGGEVQSLGQNAHSRMLTDQRWPCIGSACLRTTGHHAVRLTACQDRMYSCRTHASGRGGQIHSCHGDGGRGEVAGPERSLAHANRSEVAVYRLSICLLNTSDAADE